MQSLVDQPSAWAPKAARAACWSCPLRPGVVRDPDVSRRPARASDRVAQTGPALPPATTSPRGSIGYLDPDIVEPAELTSRLARFEQQFAASVDAAQPLVGIKKAVLVAVHDRNDVPSETFFTELPVRPNSAGRAVVQGPREQGPVERRPGQGFIESDRAFIDAFTVLVEPYEPVVFDSLMKPIAEEWGDRSKTADGREEFWRWRRARSLPEFIPVAPAVRQGDGARMVHRHHVGTDPLRRPECPSSCPTRSAAMASGGRSPRRC